jgi:hypothetical protein
VVEADGIEYARRKGELFAQEAEEIALALPDTAARAALLALVACGGALLVGCASDPTQGYALNNTYSADVRSIQVPIFRNDTFDFGKDAYFEGIYAFSEEHSSMKELKESKVARGSKDGLYINRTYFGLYSLLNQLKANINTHSVFKTMVVEF